MSVFNQYAVVYTDVALPIDYHCLKIDPLNNKVLVEFCLGERKICRSQISMELWESLTSSGNLTQPQRLGLIGIEQEDGVDGLIILLSFDEVQDEPETEPWLQSVPRYEDEDEEEDSPLNACMVVIGRIFRSNSEREHDDLYYEITAMLAKLIGGDEARILTPEQKAVEELLASLD